MDWHCSDNDIISWHYCLYAPLSSNAGELSGLHRNNTKIWLRLRLNSEEKEEGNCTRRFAGKAMATPGTLHRRNH